MSTPGQQPPSGSDWRTDRRAIQRRRLRKLRWLALFALVAFLIFVAASFAAAAYTERSSFCETACHEMGPYGRTWEKSAHKDVACVKCHIKPGTIELVEAKGSALREVYVHFTGQVKAPIAVTEHIPDSTCQEGGCHAPGTIEDPASLPSASAVASPNPAARPARSAPPVAFSHAQHAKVPLCIECHSQVVHRSVPGKPYLDPTTMAYCLRCHDGKQASAACDTCHKPAHAPRGACTKCHSLASWSSTFSHPVPLGAQHKTVVCERCHIKATNAMMGFPAGCVACHAKPHKNVKTVLCAKCHVPAFWKPSTFKHPKTGCETCHTRPHADRGPCLRCHTTSSWASHFSHPIALGGVHASFPCERCHTNGLGAPGRACVSCHGVHHGSLTDCAGCHATSGWSPSTFNHPATGMDGWQSMACTQCHPNNQFAKVYCTCHGGNVPSGD